MRTFSDLSLLLPINLIFCLVLSYLGIWYFAFISAAVLAFFLKSRWINLIYFGFSGAIGVIIPIFFGDVVTRLAAGAELASIIGLPGGAVGPLILTLLIAFFLSGLAAVVTSSLRDFS